MKRRLLLTSKKTKLSRDYCSVAFFLTFPFLYVSFYLFKFRISREKQITLRSMVEKGTQIPPEMFMEGKKDINPIDKDRKKGILFSLSSLGAIVFLNVIPTSPKSLWAIGLIPLLLGIGYLINWKISEKSQLTSEQN